MHLPPRTYSSLPNAEPPSFNSTYGLPSYTEAGPDAAEDTFKPPEHDRHLGDAGSVISSGSHFVQGFDVHDNNGPQFMASYANGYARLSMSGDSERPLRTPSFSEEHTLGAAATPPGQKVSFQEWTLYIVLGSVFLAAILSFAIYQQKIATLLHPMVAWVFAFEDKRTPQTIAAFVLLTVLIITLSLPPFLGNELVAIFVGHSCGIYGLGIVGLGTLLGELATFFTFRYVLSTRFHPRFARTIDDGSVFGLVLAARYSFLPPQYTTAAFSSLNVPFWKWLTAVVLSLPKHFVFWYIGFVGLPFTPIETLVGKISTTSSTSGSTFQILEYILIAFFVGVAIATSYYLRFRFFKAESAHYRNARLLDLSGKV